MKRIITGTLIFFVTLFVGIQTAAFVTSVMERFSVPADLAGRGYNDQADGVATAVYGIHISYIGVKESALRFLIYNGSTERLRCLGYSGICVGPELRINGLDASAWVCLNGSSEYEIKPGEAVEMMVFPYDFALIPGKNEMVEVGFKSIDANEEDQYFAQPIVLPPAFRNEIRKSLSEFGKY